MSSEGKCPIKPQKYTHLCDTENRVQDEVKQQVEDIMEAETDEDLCTVQT